VADTLLGSLTPAVNNALDSGLTVGTRIRFEADRSITKVRWHFPTPVPSNTVPWAIWEYNPVDDTAGALLGSGSFSASPDPNAWNEVSITSIPRNAGDEIVVAVWTATRYVATTNFFGADVPSVEGDLVGPAEVIGTPNKRNGRFRSGGSLLYPSSGSNKSCYFVDIEVSEAAPESVDLTPATLTFAAQPVTPVSGAVTVAIDPAALTLGAVSVTPVSGAVTVDLSAALLAISAQPVTPTVGPVTVALSPAVMSFGAVQVLTDSSLVLRPDLGTIMRPDLGVVLRP
jgi:hypothetical protein